MTVRTGSLYSYSITNSKVHVILMIIDVFIYIFKDADGTFMLI